MKKIIKGNIDKKFTSFMYGDNNQKDNREANQRTQAPSIILQEDTISGTAQQKYIDRLQWKLGKYNKIPNRNTTIICLIIPLPPRNFKTIQSPRTQKKCKQPQKGPDIT